MLNKIVRTIKITVLTVIGGFFTLVSIGLMLPDIEVEEMKGETFNDLSAVEESVIENIEEDYQEKSIETFVTEEPMESSVTEELITVIEDHTKEMIEEIEVEVEEPALIVPAVMPVESVESAETSEESGDVAGSLWYVSSHYSSKYYYHESCNGWQGLSPRYLKSFSSEYELNEAVPGRTLHYECNPY